MKTTIKIRDDSGIIRYQLLGIAFLLTGVFFTEYSYFIIKNISLSAFGLSIIVIALTMIFLANDPPLSIVTKSLIDGFYENVGSQLDLFEAKERCVYVPPKENHICAYVPVDDQFLVGQSLQTSEIPFKIIKNTSTSKGIVIYIPLSISLLSSISKEMPIEKALSEILVEYFKTTQSIKLVELNNVITVKMIGCNIENSNMKVVNLLGSFNTMISGSVISYLKNKALVVKEENFIGDNVVTSFEVLD